VDEEFRPGSNGSRIEVSRGLCVHSPHLADLARLWQNLCREVNNHFRTAHDRRRNLDVLEIPENDLDAFWECVRWRQCTS